MSLNKSTTSKIASFILLVVGLSFTTLGAFRTWQDFAPVRDAFYIPISENLKDQEFAAPLPNMTQPIPESSLSESSKSSEPKSPSPQISQIENEELIGTLFFPSLSQKYSVYEGTSVDVLRLGVGHLVSTSLPGKPFNTVLAGHRETVFRDLGKLRSGDLIQFQYGTQLFKFEVSKTFVVSAQNREVSRFSKSERLTLVTCFPFSFTSDPVKRFVLIAYPVLDPHREG